MAITMGKYSTWLHFMNSLGQTISMTTHGAATIVAFKSHEKSSCHQEAVDMVITLPSTTTPIGTLLQHAQEMATNRKIFLKILACMKFLARQDLPFRGHDDDSEGNFSQILKHHAKEETDLSDWLQRKNNKYTSHEIQNKIIQIMAHQVLRDLASKIQNSKSICIMIDETNDITNKEQVTIVIRSINEELEVSEDFLGLYIVSSIDASSLFSVVSDVLTRLKYKILLNVAKKKVKIALSELTNAASALEQVCLFFLFKHLQASKTEHSVSVFLVVEK